VLADEPAPEGVDPQILAALQRAEPQPGQAEQYDQPDNQFQLRSVMTALTQEIKLQGRTFKQLQDALSPLANADTQLASLCQAQAQSGQSADRLADAFRDFVQASEQADRTAALDCQLLDVLLDLHSRFGRGLESCQAIVRRVEQSRRTNVWRKMLGVEATIIQAHDAVQSLQEGYALTLHRITEALDQHRISPIDCLGKQFDPHTMVAANVVASTTHPAGTVLEVYQPGFLRGGEVLRLAKVKVAGQNKEAGGQPPFPGEDAGETSPSQAFSDNGGNST